MPLIYDELRQVARGYLRRERADHTLQATGLVHEAYLRLVDHARRHRAEKRGGDWEKVEFDDALATGLPLSLDLVALDEALQELAQIDPRQSQVVELRFFGGLTTYAGGLEAFQTALTLSKEAAQQAPDDFRAQRAVWLTEFMTCEHFIDQGNGTEAVRGCEGTIGFPRRALEKEPENGVVAYDLAISYFNRARAYRLTGNFQETITNADVALGVMSKLSAKRPTMPITNAIWPFTKLKRPGCRSLSVSPMAR